MNVRFAREFPSIVRDSLNPHADLLRDLKHKCELQRDISNIYFTIYSLCIVSTISNIYCLHYLHYLQYLLSSVCQQFCKLLLRRVSVAVLVARTSPVIMVTAGPGMLRDWARCVDNM